MHGNIVLGKYRNIVTIKSLQYLELKKKYFINTSEQWGWPV